MFRFQRLDFGVSGIDCRCNLQVLTYIMGRIPNQMLLADAGHANSVCL